MMARNGVSKSKTWYRRTNNVKDLVVCLCLSWSSDWLTQCFNDARDFEEACAPVMAEEQRDGVLVGGSPMYKVDSQGLIAGVQRHMS